MITLAQRRWSRHPEFCPGATAPSVQNTDHGKSEGKLAVPLWGAKKQAVPFASIPRSSRFRSREEAKKDLIS